MRDALNAILAEIKGMRREDLPRLLGDLEELRATATARLMTPADQSDDPNELIGVSEAAGRLGVSVDYLYHHHPKLPFTRHVGRKLLFSAKGIEEYIQKRCS